MRAFLKDLSAKEHNLKIILSYPIRLFFMEIISSLPQKLVKLMMLNNIANIIIIGIKASSID